jgi:hypothetical protein
VPFLTFRTSRSCVSDHVGFFGLLKAHAVTGKREDKKNYECDVQQIYFHFNACFLTDRRQLNPETQAE